MEQKRLEDLIMEAMNTIVDDDGDITNETIRAEIAPVECTDQEILEAQKLYFS
jgi:hypothetical protein